MDEEYRPKKVYDMLDKLINETWKTSLTEDLNADGEISFRGFYGKYSINVTMASGKVVSYPIHLRNDEGNRWVFKVE